MAALPRRLRFKALIVGSKPPIWRTIDIDPTLTLDHLHDVLQIAFGWADYHLHNFDSAKPYSRPRPGEQEPKRYGPPRDEDGFWSGEAMFDERRQTVGRFLTEATSPVYYLYDYGDDWTVRLEFIESRAAEKGEPRAAVVTAKLRAPTEDSGGIWGWEEKRRILADPNDPEHAEIAEWMQEVDPDGWPITDDVDLAGLNAQLAQAVGGPRR